jgi:DNA (cytosine-5)-methyltransferase 1
VPALKKPTAIDLFSGAGGTALGLVEAGYEIIAGVDNDTSAAETYRRNISGSLVEDDIRVISPAVLRDQLGIKKGELDLLAGCPPCQGFSRIRNKAGSGDERNELVLTYLTFVAEFRPKFVLFENVPGLVRSRHGKKYYKALLQGLKDLRYHIEEHLLDAADFGVPQHRRRVIVIGAKGRLRAPRLIPTHAHPNDPAVKVGRKAPWVTVRDAIGKYPEL